MRFKDLDIGAKFKIAREKGQDIYIKTERHGQFNARWENQKIFVHGLTVVKEIK